MIHPTAIVAETAQLEEGVQVGAYAIVEDDVTIGEGSVLEAHAIVKRGSRIGKSVTVGHFATIGALPQDLSFDANTESYVVVGDHCVFREGVTVSRATQPTESTRLGTGCFLMAESHVGHDCDVGNDVIMANGSLLAGHVSVGDNVFFGGLGAVHQFCRIGEGVMYGGQSAATKDVPPFTKFDGRNTLFGLNLVGLRRRGHSRESIQALQQCYRQIFSEPGNLKKTAAAMLEGAFGSIEETRRFLAFFLTGDRGFARPSQGAKQR